MGHVLPFASDPHRETRELMSWLATGKLAPDEQARVEAHLAVCEECRQELAEERKLAGAVATLPFESESSWSVMRARIDATARLGTHRPPPAAPVRGRLTSRKIGVFLAAQAALLVAAISITVRTTAPTAPFHTLSSAPIAASGNAVIIFRPDTREGDIRRLLKESSARIVDGPTVANAFVLRIPVAERDQALGRLRKDDAVTLAEPLGTTVLR